MRSLLVLICLSLASIACDRLVASKYTKYANSNISLELDYDAISRDLEPLISSCNDDAECKIGSLPSDPFSCSGEAEGAYLVAKETEFNQFKTELAAAIDAVNSQGGSHIRTGSQLPAEAGEPTASFSSIKCALDPAVVLHVADGEAKPKCVQKFCKIERRSKADFTQAVGMSVRDDRLSDEASMSILDGRFQNYFGSPITQPENFPNLGDSELVWAFRVSSSGDSQSQFMQLYGSLSESEVAPLKQIASSIRVCDRGGFSYYQNFNTAVPAIYCGSYALGLNDFSFDRRGYSYSYGVLCDASSEASAKSLAQALKALISSKVGTLSSDDQAALDSLGAWEPGPTSGCGLD